MKIVPGSRRRRYVARVSPFLITVVLVVGMVGCGPTQYNLTISSTEGGEVTTPGEGTFTYDNGTLVSLVAEAEDGYWFAKWTGDVDTIDEVNSADTNITVNNHYSIIAKFVPGDFEAIWNWYDLAAIRNNLNGNYILMDDLDSTTPGYEELVSPIGRWYPIGTHDAPFSGAFDGQGYEIRDLFINRPSADHIGLFGSVEPGGVIQDVGIVNATVIGAQYVGSLVGYSQGTAANSYSTGSVTGDRWVGGLAGYNMGTVRDSYSSSNVTGNERVGGLAGTNYEGTVSNSYFTGSVSGTSGVGGLAGENCYGYGGIVSNSYYSYDEVLINGENVITGGALFDEDFEQWLANDKFLDVNERLLQEDGYYVINNVTDFKRLLAFGQNATLIFRLNSDLDLGDEPNFYIPCLAGEFAGNGHKISNVSFSFDFVYDVGLFGYLATSGNVTDLAAENVNITGDKHVGGLVGFNMGTVGNSSCTGSVTGHGCVGGLVGLNWYLSTVSSSYFTGTVTGESTLGGLVGQNMGTVTNSSSNGSVSGSSGQAGGLVAYNGGTVSHSYSTAGVTGDNNIGGLVGQNSGTISNSYSSGDVTAYAGVVGGLVGANYDTVSTCYSTGDVNGSSSVGGLVGYNGYGGSVSKSFWDTETSGHATSDGGTGKNTTEMKDIATFSGAGWNITAVADPSMRNPAYIWNIVDDETYPFLSWQP